MTSPFVDRAAEAAAPPRPERRRLPAAVRGPYLAAVRRAWRAGVAPVELALALAAFARDGRARALPLDVLLRALDVVLAEPDGRGAMTEAGALRGWAAAHVLRLYHGLD